jgi:hypothetical protein
VGEVQVPRMQGMDALFVRKLLIAFTYPHSFRRKSSLFFHILLRPKGPTAIGRQPPTGSRPCSSQRRKGGLTSLRSLQPSTGPSSTALPPKGSPRCWWPPVTGGSKLLLRCWRVGQTQTRLAYPSLRVELQHGVPSWCSLVVVFGGLARTNSTPLHALARPCTPLTSLIAPTARPCEHFKKLPRASCMQVVP